MDLSRPYHTQHRNIANRIGRGRTGKASPPLTGRAPPNAEERDLLALPGRLGRIGIGDFSQRAPDDFAASVLVTSPLKDLFTGSDGRYTFAANEEQIVAKSDNHNQRRAQEQAAANLVKPQLPNSLQ